MAVRTRYAKWIRIILKSLIVLFTAKGANTRHATVQRQKANPIGGMCSFIPLAMTIFPDQSKVANKANRIPLVALFITEGLEFWHIAVI